MDWSSKEDIRFLSNTSSPKLLWFCLGLHHILNVENDTTGNHSNRTYKNPTATRKGTHLRAICLQRELRIDFQLSLWQFSAIKNTRFVIIKTEPWNSAKILAAVQVSIKETTIKPLFIDLFVSIFKCSSKKLASDLQETSESISLQEKKKKP